MFLPKKIYFKSSETRFNNYPDVMYARNYFFSNLNKNLYHLLHQRYSWMNNFIKDNDNVIELGCGTGLAKEFIKNKNFKISDVFEFDFLDYKKINALDTGFKNKTFSVVIASNLIHHIAYPAKLFKEVHRILKPNGIFIVQDVNCSFLMKIAILVMKSEGYDFCVDVLNNKKPCNDENDPWSGNNAIPNLIFDNFKNFNDSLENKFEIISSQKNEFLSFINSGGVNLKTFYIPLNDALNKFIIKLDKLFTLFPNIFALQQSHVLKKIS